MQDRRKSVFWSSSSVSACKFSQFIQALKCFWQPSYSLRIKRTTPRLFVCFLCLILFFFPPSIREHWQVERLYLSTAVLTDIYLWVLFCLPCDGSSCKLPIALCHHLWNAGKENTFTGFVSWQQLWLLIYKLPFIVQLSPESAFSYIHMFL